MSEELHSCPYTGLRSFTEEESLYFKGRDPQIDQISKLLERNKFLMVTGASGEGKSSLIFAGLIPNARAGFFKARYNNWVVADFRPERTPVKNMAAALARITGRQASTTETELRRGFASLVDLYSTSELFIDDRDEKWLQLPEEDKKSRKRNAANLLILVDQFEEFFTNPENFHRGAPSQDSQIVVNVLLETARIALNENLPIYVVCTMRSDYIGQCSAFRDLPEYIGFSQFFVPRLKRKELKQIIEEPAVLSGNQISQRLVERLVYDLAEGVDQLPILQHALSQIWLAADHGKEEMDLVHYAMVGGMQSSELTKEDQLRFESWFQRLPEYNRNFYRETGLDRVIELHANRLYEGAWEYYNNGRPDKPITQRDAKNIIALTFACLTKIDNSRAVRNRMTLDEITQILNRPGLTAGVVGEVLNAFREEVNSFIRPFKTSDPETFSLSGGSVLDITHESLIRNWGRLNKWANQEYEFYTTFLDFKKQLDRWIENKKSKDYLLPIGPLSFFENWYARCKPNAFWINRYIEQREEQSLSESEHLLEEIQEFLRRSARKVIITRTFMKYGANRIAAVTAILLMIVFSGFYWVDADQKKNSRVIEKIRISGERLLGSREVDIATAADYLLTEERYEPGKLMDYLGRMNEPKASLNLSLASYKELLMVDKHTTRKVKSALVDFIDHGMETCPKGDIDFTLEKYNLFIALLAYDNYYNSNKLTQVKISKNAAALADILRAVYSDKSNYKAGLSARLNLAVQNWLTYGHPNPRQIQEIILAISPLSSPTAKTAFAIYYPKGSYEDNYDFAMDYGGGYHMLAALYAAAGETGTLLTCFGELMEDPNYFKGIHAFNNYPGILGYLYQYGHPEGVQPVVQWISTHGSIPEVEIYSTFYNQTGPLKHLFLQNIERSLARSFRGYFYPNLDFLNEAEQDQIWNDFEKAILRLNNPAERNFRLALALKMRAIHDHKYHFDRGSAQDVSRRNEWLNKSWSSFTSVPEDYLQERISITYRYYTDGKRDRIFTRKQQYLYPDILGSWLDQTYQSDVFFNFMAGQEKRRMLYASLEELDLLRYWVSNCFEIFPRAKEQTFKNDYPLADSTLQRVLKIVESNSHKNDFDANLLNMVLANRAFSRGDTVAGFTFFRSVKQENIYATANAFEYLGKTFVYNQLKDLCAGLAVLGHRNEALALAERFEKPEDVISVYLFSASRLYDQDYDPQTFILLDSVLTKMKKVKLNELNPFSDFRYRLLNIFGKMGGEEIEQGAKKILKDMDENSKWTGNLMLIWGLANQGNYYRAVEAIPPSFTETQDLLSRVAILNEACAERERNDVSTAWRELGAYLTYEFNYVFYEPF